MVTPGPGQYRNESSIYIGSQKGGTGVHNGFSISFTKDKRNINRDVERKTYIPGPGQYSTEVSKTSP